MSEYIVRETGYPGAVAQEIIGELVRCKDCKYAEMIENEDIYCHSYGGVLTNNPEWYCASGERKDDGMDS